MRKRSPGLLSGQRGGRGQWGSSAAAARPERGRGCAGSAPAKPWESRDRQQTELPAGHSTDLGAELGKPRPRSCFITGKRCSVSSICHRHQHRPGHRGTATPEPRPLFLSQNKLISFGTEGQTRSPAHLSGTGSPYQPGCYLRWEGWTSSLTENSNACWVCSLPPQKVTLQAELKGRLAQTQRLKQLMTENA